MGVDDLPTWNPSSDELEEIRKKQEKIKADREAAQRLNAPQSTTSPTTPNTTASSTTPAPTNVSQAIAGGQEAFTARFEAGEEDTTEDTLVEDDDFLMAARNVYRFNHNGRDFDGSDQELADYALDTMGWFNYNLPKMTVDASIISRADDNTRASFLYLMEAYDDKNISWDGTWRFVKGVATDPTTYAGLASFGIGTGASFAGKQLGKEGLKALLKGGMRNTVIAATEGAIYGAVDDINRQVIETSVTGEDIDLGRTLKSSALSAATAGTIGLAATPAINQAQKLLGAKPKKRKTSKGAAKTADDATPADGATKDINEAGAKLVTRVEQEGASEPKLGVTSAILKIREAVEKTTKDGFVAVDPETGVQKRKLIKDATDMLTSVLGKVVHNTDGSLDTNSLTQQILGMQLTQAEFNALGISVQRTMSDLVEELDDVIRRQEGDLSEDAAVELGAAREELEDLFRKLNILDEGFRSTNARSQGARRENIYRGELLNLLPEDIKVRDNVTQEVADREWLAMVDKQRELLSKDTDIKRLNGEIERALKKNRIEKAAKLSAERRELLKQKMDAQNPGIGYKAKASFRRTVEGVNEFVIGTVFTTSTIVVNTLPSLVKTAYKPFLNFVVEGDYASSGFRKMTGTYSAMWRMREGAAKAAIAAYKYERGMLTGDYSRFMENHNVIPQRFKKYVPVGSVIRLFPNILNMTDEFFQQINYRGYVEGQAIANAILHNKSLKRPKKGKALEDYIQEEVDKVILNAYENLDEVQIKQNLLEQAEARGMNPKQAKKFVADEFKKDKDRQAKGKDSIFRNAKNKEGRSYTEDLLFKRQFSGDGTASQTAQKYEQFVRDNPWMKIIGQLFFRTPVRVFEEGIRMTPGIQLIAPKYIQDLRGANGTARQVRAQGEALLSYGIAGYVMMQYAQGSITGAGTGDYKRRKMQEDTDRQQPYTIKFDDGTTLSFKNYDPFSTPIKIMVNAFERYEEVEYRRRQGEYVEDELGLIRDRLYVGVGSLFNAIKDASLMEGLDQASGLIQSFGKEDAWYRDVLKFMGQKTQLAFPNMIYKTKNAFFDDTPTLKNPVGFLQHLEARMDLGFTPVSNQYDILGNARPIEAPTNSLHGIFITDEEDRRKGKSERDLFVLRKMELIAIATDSAFEIPARVPNFFGNRDLRTEAYPGEDKTLYDRYVEIYREANGGITNILYPILSNGDQMYGTASQDGAISQVVRSVIAKQRQVAAILLLEELGKMPEFTNRKVRQGEAKAGLRDDTIFPNVRD
jgi:hypothetical protein